MIKLIIIVFLFFATFSLFAQTDINVTSSDTTQTEDFFTYLSNSLLFDGKILIQQNADIEGLINKHIACGEKRGGFPGYRIRIFSDLGYDAREEAIKTRALFIKQFSDTPNYLLYDDPNFKVVVGDFRTKSEALKFLKEIGDDYPNAFIIKDLINCPK